MLGRGTGDEGQGRASWVLLVCFKKEMIFVLRRLFDGIEKATDGKTKIEDARQRAWILEVMGEMGQAYFKK